LTDQPPEGADWIHEIKHDGYRTMLTVERGTARAYTRNGHDWSDRYPGIIASARKLPCRSAILDGEVIVQDARGVSDFEALQTALRSQPTRLIYYAPSIFCTSTARACSPARWSNAERSCRRF
jgi:ATP-dependent DNA ligase